jgi:hypothetical protein
MTNNQKEGETQIRTEHITLREKLIEAHVLEKVLMLCALVFVIAFFMFDVFGKTNIFIFVAAVVLFIVTAIGAMLIMRIDQTRTLYKVLVVYEIILLVFYLFLFLWIALNLL